MEHKLGKFSSWVVKSKSLICKQCDESSRTSKGTVVDQNIVWWWHAEHVKDVARINVVFTYKNQQFEAYLKATSTQNSVRLFWKTDLQRLIQSRNPKYLTFWRVSNSIYEIAFK